MNFGIVIIGSELLTGKRRDGHLQAVIERLHVRRHELGWVRIIGDEPAFITQTLRETAQETVPVFVFGGIGATPDDHTRRCAAEAFDLPLIQHPEAAQILTERYGERVQPQRILMANLPQHCTLIPNPVGTAPGFRVARHHFLPGFPEMAWPMLETVLDNDFPADTSAPPTVERLLRVIGTSEGDMVPLMEKIIADHPQVALSCLPQMAKPELIVEFGLRGSEPSAQAALEDLRTELTNANIRHEPLPAID